MAEEYGKAGALSTEVEDPAEVHQATAVPVQKSRAMGTSTVEQEKQGGVCCGCCCDYRRAVIILSIIYIIMSVISLVVDNSVTSTINDEVDKILTDYRNKMRILAIVDLISAVVSFIGAILFVWPLVSLKNVSGCMQGNNQWIFPILQQISFFTTADCS